MTSQTADAKLALTKRIKEVAYLTGEFTTRAGKKTNYYIDKYLFETQPDILNAIADQIITFLPDLNTFDCIAAPELGAVPLASVVSVKINKPFVIVRKAGKEYGTQRLIEGKIQAGDRAVLVEDVLTTGGAAIRAADILVEQNVIITKIIGVINRQEGAIENIQAKGWSVDWLITSDDLKAC